MPGRPGPARAGTGAGNGRSPPRPAGTAGVGSLSGFVRSRQRDRLEVERALVVPEDEGVPLVEQVELDDVVQVGDRLVREALEAAAGDRAGDRFRRIGAVGGDL